MRLSHKVYRKKELFGCAPNCYLCLLTVSAPWHSRAVLGFRAFLFYINDSNVLTIPERDLCPPVWQVNRLLSTQGAIIIKPVIKLNQ